MAPVSAASRPRNQRRDNKDLYNAEIGVVGRRTQQTLPPLGPRDDHGLEPTDKLFSSAAKSRVSSLPSPDENARQDDEGYKRKRDLSSDSMDLVNKRRIIVTDNRRSTLQRKTPLKQIERKRIPIGGTPIRGSSVGLSSPHRPTTPTRQPSSPTRYLQDRSLPSIEHSPEKPTSVSNSSAKRIRTPKSIYTRLSQSPKGPYHHTPHLPVPELSSPHQYGDNEGAADTYDPGLPDDDEPDVVDNIDPELESLSAHADNQLASTRINPPTPRTATKTPASRRTDTFAATPRSDGPVSQDVAELPEGHIEETEEPAESAEPEPEPEPAVQPKNEKKKRGRPPKGSKSLKLKAKDPNAQPTRKDGFKKPAAPGKNPSNVRVRSETPFDESTHTRSGRMVYKPLEYWRGERVKLAVIRDAESDAVIESVDEIIRMEDVTPIKRTRQPSEPPARGKKRKRTVFQDAPEDDEDDREEDWERDEGVISGPVRVWDEETGTTINEERDHELAFAGSHIETREVPNAEFRYAKTLTMPFFGTGMVELPPRGYKRVKNSRKMHMVFFVHYGKVCVEVAGTMFTISKGGVWQVPRGNFYAITNETEHSALIFFAQGCEIPAGVVNPPDRQLARPEPA